MKNKILISIHIANILCIFLFAFNKFSILNQFMFDKDFYADSSFGIFIGSLVLFGLSITFFCQKKWKQGLYVLLSFFVWILLSGNLMVIIT